VPGSSWNGADDYHPPLLQELSAPENVALDVTFELLKARQKYSTTDFDDALRALLPLVCPSSSGLETLSHYSIPEIYPVTHIADAGGVGCGVLYSAAGNGRCIYYGKAAREAGRPEESCGPQRASE
jgi:hypothetical protein